jgi:hypothetical protein
VSAHLFQENLQAKKRKEKLVDSTANPPYLPGRSSEKTYISHFDHGRSKIRSESCGIPAVFGDAAGTCSKLT